MRHYRNNELLLGIASVAKELREHRKPKISQETVMNDIKIKTNISIHLGRIETGGINITISNLSLLCDYYEISLSDFMERVEESIRKQKLKRKKRL